ncbi:SDR family NAD(P)-dependent oxidoreductase [Sphingosinicella sp.]|uniref:SDR family NAD(P)-dependent oxidoreductase n=3 Tax=Sphingosinicella sp. TaxID=1917971 RepID=UPI00261162C2|nr:SDR family NAD(P)-dependent oxidoreductase [Sphingosinicella sp.]
MNRLEGKAAVVTGGGRGIGRGHCLQLAAAGAKVIVNDMDEEVAETVVTEIRGAGGIAESGVIGIDSRAGAEALIARCIDHFGHIDILVNNAGNLRDRTFLRMTDEEFDAVWTVHVKGTFWCSQAAALAMRDDRRGGSIVNTTSGAHFGSFGQTNYAAAKGAIASMTYTWALELARFGIRVNAIGPTGTTRMSDTFAGGASPLPYIDPTLNGALVAFLCSDLAAGVSGQIFGSGGERVSHMVQPHYGKTLIREGGWTIDALAEHFSRQFAGEFGPLGMLGEPYPFHGGVTAEHVTP